MDYQEFIKTKMPVIESDGFEPQSDCPEWFLPHQRDCVNWAIRKGRAALFESFGLGKTVQQLQLCKWIHEHTGDVVLDPFGGVHSTPYQAVKMGRKGWGIELNRDYWKFGVAFCERAERELCSPTLFDLCELDGFATEGV